MTARVEPGVFFAPAAVLPRGRHTLARNEVIDAQRERLMVAMTELMAERGYRGVSLGDVVARAGVSRTAFYQSFAHKADCAFAAYDRFIDVLLRDIAERTAAAADWDAFMVALLEGYVMTLERDLVVARAFQIEMDAVGPEARRRRRDALQRFAVFIREQEERFADDDPTLLRSSAPETYLGVVYAARQVVCDELDRDERPDLRALVPVMAPWMAASFRASALSTV